MKAQIFYSDSKSSSHPQYKCNKKLLSRILSANDDIVAFGTFSVL